MTERDRFELDLAEALRAYAQDARIYDQGSLTLDVVDVSRGVLVWRGTAMGSIKPNSLPKERPVIPILPASARQPWPRR